MMSYTTLSTPRCVTFKIVIGNFYRAKKYISTKLSKKSRQHIWTLHFLPKLKIIKYSLIITSYEVICGKKTIRSTVHSYLGVPQQMPL